MYINNPNWNEQAEDNLYHFGLSTAKDDFVQLFGDVKFVCTGGSAGRMAKLARMFQKEFDPSSTKEPINLCQADRFVMYKVGPVLCVNHGMGMPSMSIMLHELFKLLRHAGCKDVLVFRVGTSGGVGLPAGTVVITEQAFNALLEPNFVTECLGKTVSYPTRFDTDLCEELFKSATSIDVPVIKGNSVGTNDFYEGQGRLDGALCTYTEKDKMEFLEKAARLGVKNFEMEAPAFAAMTARAGIKSAVICVTLLDRIHGDQVRSPVDVLKGYEERPCRVLIEFIKRRLQSSSSPVTNGIGIHVAKVPAPAAGAITHSSGIENGKIGGS